MTHERWKKLDALFHEALSLQGAARAARLADEPLRAEVEQLLAAHERESSFLDAPLLAPPTVEAHAESSIGRSIGHYQIISELGRGGMGEVYLAADTRLGRQVALKLLPAEFTTDAERVRRFEQEARAASALNHPNIITIFDIDSDAARRFIVMELVVGRTLREVLAQGPSIDALLQLGGQMAQALSVAHAAGITHRDIKPDNIMVRADGYVKVLDFGLARLLPATTADAAASALVQQTSPGTLVGTVAYMSPEQARGEAVSHPADIFALGIVFYELATGRHPFKAETPLGYLHAITLQTPPSLRQLQPDIPAALEALILRMLDKEAVNRPTASAVAQQLREIERTNEREQENKKAGIPSPIPVPSIPLLPATPIRHTVGHTKERHELRAACNAAHNGRGALLCVAGEPGIGKTTLVEDFLAELARENQCLIARGRCSERLAGAEAYLPLLEALESLLRDSAARESGTLAARLRQLAPTWYAQVAALNPDDSDAQRLLADVKAASQERMKRELAAFLQAVAQTQPLVIFFDDLHWADVSTIDLLNFLAGKFAALRVLIVVTYRPSDMLLAKHSFLQIKPDLQARGVCRELLLEFLTAAEIAEYLALQFPGHRFPAEFPKLIHAKTEGSPLFMADLVRYLRDHGVLAQTSGAWALEQTLPDLERELPESVRGMIERKIAQLEPDDRKLLTAASVQGAEFDSAVVAQVLKLDADEVEERLEKLERVYAFVKLTSESEFPNRTLTLRYRFVHVLYQNALYAGLRATRRATLSRAVAETLEDCYGAQRASAANELAALWEAGRELAQAAHYFHLASEQASYVFASQEAELLARRGLRLVQSLPAGREQQEQELALQVRLGNALLGTQGWAAPEVGQAYQRARELCAQLGDTASLPPVLFGLYYFLGARGNFAAALALGKEFLALTEDGANPARLMAHRMIGCPLFFRGELQEARAQFAQIDLHYDPAEHRSLIWLYGNDAGISGRSYLALTLWLLGSPEQALQLGQQLLPMGRTVSHADSQAFALCFAALIHQCRRESPAALELAEATVELATEQGLALWRAWGTMLRGWALSEQGQAATGITELQRGLAAYQATGGEVFQPYFQCLLAAAYAQDGRPRPGLTTLETAQALVEKHSQRWWEAELHRLRGELLLQTGSGEAEVECAFQQALAIARQQSAKSLELRAATSLARLWQKQGKTVAACSALAEIYDWFTEGFDTRDLQDAQALLEEMRTAGESDDA